MKLTKTRVALLGGLALTAAVATASLAAEPPPAGAPPSGHDGMMMRRMDDPAARARRAERHAQHLRDALQLRPDQEPALKAFLEASKPPAGAMDRMRQEHEHEGDAPLTTPQRLDRMLAHLDQARSMMAAHAAAVKTFYAALSPAQQKAFDALGPMGGGPRIRMRMHMGGPGGHGMHGGPGMMGDLDDDDMGGERRVIIMRHGGEGGPPPPPGE